MTLSEEGKTFCLAVASEKTWTLTFIPALSFLQGTSPATHACGEDTSPSAVGKREPPPNSPPAEKKFKPEVGDWEQKPKANGSTAATDGGRSSSPNSAAARFLDRFPFFSAAAAAASGDFVSNYYLM